MALVIVRTSSMPMSWSQWLLSTALGLLLALVSPDRLQIVTAVEKESPSAGSATERTETPCSEAPFQNVPGPCIEVSWRPSSLTVRIRNQNVAERVNKDPQSNPSPCALRWEKSSPTGLVPAR